MRLVERGRHRRRRRVAVRVDVEEEAFHRIPTPLGHALQDAQVGLMRDQPRRRRRRSCRWRPAPRCAAAAMLRDRVLVDLAAVHLHEVPLRRDGSRASSGSRLPPAGCHRISVSAPSANRCVDRMPRRRPSSAVINTAPAPSPNSTQVAAVGPVDDARQHLDADDQHVLELPGANERVRDRHAVEESGAGRRQVERAAGRASRPASSARTSPSAGTGSRRSPSRR